MEWFLLLFVLVVLAGVVGAAWVVWAGVRGVYRGIAGLVTPAVAAEVGVSRCRQVGCRTANPPHARFCRRCGSGMVAATPRPPAVAHRLAALEPDRLVPAGRVS